MNLHDPAGAPTLTKACLDLPESATTASAGEGADPANRWMTNVDRSLRYSWHPVAMSADVGANPVRAVLLGQAWVLARVGTELIAMADRCPHRFAPLSAGRIIEGTVECPYHGYRFALDGKCVAIPALDPAVPIPHRAAATPAGGIAERYGLIWLAPENPITPLPEIPEWDAESMVAVAVPPIEWHATAAQMADNFLDVAHFPFLHRDTIGDPDDRVVTPYAVERDEWRFSVVHEHTAKTLKDSMGAAADGFDLARRRMTFETTAPHHIRLRIEYLDTGVVLVITFFHQPIDENTTRLWVWNIRNDIADGRCTTEETIAFQMAVGGEDKALLERFTLKAVPLDPTVEFHSHADRITLELRRMLADLVKATR